LLGRFNALGGKIEYNSAVAGLTQTDRGVTTELATGESVKADYMVGCDGGRSTVRGLLGIQLVGKSLDEKAMVVADLEIENLDREFWHVWPINPGGPPSLCPLPLGNLFQLQSPKRIGENGLEAIVTGSAGCSLPAMPRISIRHQAHRG
jgi:2-polyprenyl-6-methoxyphenol hydroxylase-like FAD-dependent oxidoreductase